MKQIMIPEFLSHLKVDERGYPIPFFVKWIKGKPDFRILDEHNRELCIKDRLCSICGKVMEDIFFYFISGPIGFHNKVSTDAPMHENCARYSLSVCPHLLYQRAERRDEDIMYLKNDHQILQKPPYMVLARTVRYWTDQRTGILRYTPVHATKYIYVDGKLIEEPQN